MICRQCGTEIADKALICYRCGTATTEAKFKPVDLKASRRSNLAALVVFVILALGGAYVAATGVSETTRVASGVVAVVAVLLAVRRLLLRR